MFKPVEDARLARLAAAQAAAAEKPPVTQKESGQEITTENDTAMDSVEQEQPKKTAPGPKAKKINRKGKAKNKGRISKKKRGKFF